MVLTKNDLQQIKETLQMDKLSASIDKIGENHESLVASINGVDEKLTNLETKLSHDITSIQSDISALSVQNNSLTQIVENNKVSTDNAIKGLSTKITALENEPLVNIQAFERVSKDLDTLKTKFARLEKDVYKGHQHGRLWNLEIEGIPNNIGDEPSQLEEAALAIFEAINVRCDAENIEAIHRLRSKNDIKPTILCIDSRRIVRDIHKNKHKLKDLSALNLVLSGLTDDSRIFINPSLTPYTKKIAYNCRLLRRAGMLQTVKIEDDGSIKILISEEEDYRRIAYESELTSLFPTFDGFNFDWSKNEG